ncbi:MAG: hypothetical protein CSA05_01430 [Bacteroidia bacterium]|nr:MAG: hypothetical protein CSA05_01430 [Bacteroidia bacterium]
MKIFNLSLLFILFSCPYLAAQEAVEVSDKKKLYLDVENLSFFRNNEYFNDIVEGYTLIGYWLRPALYFRSSSDFSVYAGVHLQKYAGIDDFSEILPVFYVEYAISKHIKTRLGTLENKELHALIAPIYQPERKFTESVENGLQFLFDFSRLNAHVWLNWETFIFHGDSAQEELSSGVSARWLLSKAEKKFRVSLPVQFLAYHKGGQINAGNEPLQTLLNFSGGLSMQYRFDEKKQFEADFHFVKYKDNSPTPTTVSQAGKGVFIETRLQTKRLLLEINYWRGNDYFSKHGEAIFSSVSTHKTNYYEKERSLLIPTVKYTKKIGKSCRFTTFASLCYDLNNKNADYSFGLQISWDQRFLLWK